MINDPPTMEPLAEMRRLQADRARLIAVLKMLPPKGPQWFLARAHLAVATERGEIILEQKRVADTVHAFDEEFPLSKEEEEEEEVWDCPICQKSALPKHASSSWLGCCGRRICLTCKEQKEIRTSNEINNHHHHNNNCPLCQEDFSNTTTEEAEIAAIEGNYDSWAQFRMGSLLQSRDHTKSFFYFQNAAEQGHPVAMFNLGFAYYTGANESVLPSLSQARIWFQKSAEKGYDQAQFNLGLLCLDHDDNDDNNNADGGTTPPDDTTATTIKEGIRWMTLAAAQGHVEAQDMLASLYGNASGRKDMKQNLFRAKYWAYQAGAQNNGPSQFLLAKTLILLARQTFDGNTSKLGYSTIPRMLFWLRRAEANGFTPDATQMISKSEGQISAQCACCGKSSDKDENGVNNATKLQQCGRCMAAYYCGKDCLTKHWKMGHKADCLSKDQAKFLQELMAKKKMAFTKNELTKTVSTKTVWTVSTEATESTESTTTSSAYGESWLQQLN
jgi:TPR repeat protein